MHNRLFMILGLLSLVSIAFAAPKHKPVKLRGQMLYDNHCLHCHDEGVHWRATSKVHSLDDLVHEVKKWASLQRMHWSQEDIHDVAAYMNRKYYKLKK